MPEWALPQAEAVYGIVTPPTGPSREPEKARYSEPILKKVRHLIEPINDTSKGQLDLEQHGGRTTTGVAVRIAQRLLAIAAAIWHNNKTAVPVTWSLNPALAMSAHHPGTLPSRATSQRGHRRKTAKPSSLPETAPHLFQESAKLPEQA